jgi:hypothetical protein
MEIKNNQLTIDIPEGMEIDTENSNLTEGIIKFKSKCTTYDDIVNSLSSIACINVCIHSSNIKKLIAMAQLMNIAKYVNGDWKPNWNSREEAKYYIYYNHKEGRYKVNSTARINWGDVYFRFRDNAELVMDNPNFKSILDTIYKD